MPANKKMHFRAAYNDSLSACGTMKNPLYITDNLSDVNCARCQSTSAFMNTAKSLDQDFSSVGPLAKSVSKADAIRPTAEPLVGAALKVYESPVEYELIWQMKPALRYRRLRGLHKEEVLDLVEFLMERNATEIKVVR